MSLALWLRAGRAERGLSLDDVARVTKIQPRILERLEGGLIQPGDGLPAEVFVRGFIRSYAKCCGLDEAEAISRYSAAAQGQAISPATTTSAPPAARAMVEAMADLAPQVARTTSPNMLAAPIEIVELAAGSLPEIAVPATELSAEASTSLDSRPSYASKKKRRGGRRAKRKSIATGTPSTPMPVVAAPIEAVEPVVEPSVEAPVVEALVLETKPEPIETIDATADIDAPAIVDHLDPLVEPVGDNDDVVATAIWQPKMPPVTTTASVPWRRPAYVATSTAAASVPTLVIDDADPEHAAQLMEDREAAKSVLTNAQRRSFLPPILLDREDRSARQGGLTLAVIILLIAATLTLSYLMRRPSSSGDGVTVRNVETQLIG